MPQDTPPRSIAEKLRSEAIALAKQGFRVFPLQPDGKKPEFEEWQAQASADPERVKALWSDPFGEAQPWNIGVRTGDGLTVLDVDMKHGRPGAESLDDLATFAGLELQTFTVRTPTGGLHIYYDSTGYRLKNSVETVAPGLDVRSEGGYVVGPGSTIGDRAYSTETRAALAPIAAWFAARCGHAARKSEQPAIADMDTPEALARAREWLAKHAPQVVADSGSGDHTMYQIACRLKDFGLSQAECLAAALDSFDSLKAFPPQGETIWAKKIENAFLHGQNPPGVLHASAEFDPVELEARRPPAGPAAGATATATPRRSKLKVVKGYDSLGLLAQHDEKFVVEDVLGVQEMSVLYGRSNTGKTFVWLDVALRIAAGMEWNGRKTTKGPVVYVAAEGTFGIHARVAAWAKHNKVDMRDVWFSTVPCPVDLLRPDADTKPLIELVNAEAASWGDGSHAAAFVALDTFSRVLAGGDENSGVDVGTVVLHIDMLRAATRAHVGVVHHSGKDQSRGARGWSGLNAATDVEFEIADGVLTNTKQRDRAQIEPLPFAMQDVALGANRSGKPIASLVPLYGAAAEEADGGLTEEQMRWLTELRAGAAAMAEEAGLKASRQPLTWQNASAIFSDMASPKRATVVKRLRLLTEKGHLSKGKENQWFIARL